MSYREKQTIVSLISSILIAALYFAYVVQNYPEGNSYSAEVFHFWGASLFILIPLSIVARIVVQIVFSIAYSIATHEQESTISDERDQFIELKGLRNTIYLFAFGISLAMGSLILDKPPSVMFIVLFCSGFVSGLFGDISRLYFYRKGF